jgi:hypothetical protein
MDSQPVVKAESVASVTPDASVAPEATPTVIIEKKTGGESAYPDEGF